MLKDITFNPHDKIKAGVDKLANVVKSTLGPGGNNVILQRGHVYHITKDGVSVARDIYLEDPLEQAGAQLVKLVSLKTLDDAGDGTTTATVLAQAIFSEGLKSIAEGTNVMDLKRGIDIAVKEVVKELKELSKPVTDDDIKKVALISANGDKEIGGLVSEAMETVGLEGLVTVEDSKSLDTYLKKVDGMRWDRGWMSPYFINKPEKQECYLEDPVILIYDGTLSSMRELMTPEKYNIIERYRADSELGGKPFLMIGHDFSTEAMSTMATNVQRGSIQACFVQAPEFQENRKAVLYDIAAMTGATVITRDAGFKWQDVKPEHLGRAESVRVTQWSTTIVGGHGGLKATQRAHELREQMKDTNDHALAILKSRLARLVNGLMVIYVGGSSDVEVKEKRDRIDDALNATRSAIEEGVLPGGGVAYLRAKTATARDMYSNKDQRKGGAILEAAMMVPFVSIVENVGGNGLEVLDNVLDDMRESFGFNAATLQYGDLIELGVIDPTKVVRLALENAASISGMLLTTKAVITDLKR